LDPRTAEEGLNASSDKMIRDRWTDHKLLSRLLTNKSEKSRWANIQVLRKRPSKQLFLKCIDLTKSKKPRERSVGIDIMAQLGVPPRPFVKQTLRRYFDLLNIEKNPKVLMSILYAIGHNNDKLSKAQIAKVCSMSNTNSDRVKEGLVYTLLGIDNSNAIKTLIKLSTDKLNHIRNWAVFGIGSQIERDSKIIREALLARVNDKHQETKFEAIVGLAKRKDSRVKDVIKKELLQGEYGTLLFEAVLETGDKLFLPLLRQMLTSGREDKRINPEWLKDLKNCISDLRKVSDNQERTL
jgi:hypothetical protein